MHRHYDGDQEIFAFKGVYSSTAPDVRRRYVRLPGSVDEVMLMIDYTLDAGCTNTSYAACEVWAHHDRLGSTVATSDSLGNEIDAYTYAQYGESGPEGDTGFPFRFTGQKLDAVTGLYNYKARWYDPETGRFLQTDPIGYGDGMNLYAYVGNDPVNFVDRLGDERIHIEVTRTLDGTGSVVDISIIPDEDPLETYVYIGVKQEYSSFGERGYDFYSIRQPLDAPYWDQGVVNYINRQLEELGVEDYEYDPEWPDDWQDRYCNQNIVTVLLCETGGRRLKPTKSKPEKNKKKKKSKVKAQVTITDIPTTDGGGFYGGGIFSPGMLLNATVTVTGTATRIDRLKKATVEIDNWSKGNWSKVAGGRNSKTHISVSNQHE